MTQGALGSLATPAIMAFLHCLPPAGLLAFLHRWSGSTVDIGPLNARTLKGSLPAVTLHGLQASKAAASYFMIYRDHRALDAGTLKVSLPAVTCHGLQASLHATFLVCTVEIHMCFLKGSLLSVAFHGSRYDNNTIHHGQ